MQSSGKFLYQTLSLCPTCTLVEGKGVDYVPAQVEIFENQVWLVAECKQHGSHRTLYCKDINFFLSTLKYKGPTDSFDLDVEDLPRILRGEGRGANRPLSFSLRLWKPNQTDRGEFISNQEIEESFRVFRNQMQNRDDLSYILKLEGKTCNDMEALNERVEYISNIYKGPTVLECTFDRLILVARLPNSIFQRPYVYPAVKYYFKAGQEEACLEEMEKFQRNINLEFEGLAAMCTIVLERTDFAWPNLAAALQFLRASPRFWRFVVFSAERGPDALLSITQDLKADRPVLNSVDPFEILQLFSDHSDFKMEDFIPGSACLMMEPLLYILHYGLFSLKISPFCGFVNVLINDENNTSVPLNRLLDLGKLFQKLVPLLPRIRANKYDITLPLANSLRKIFKSCTRPAGKKKYDIMSKIVGMNSAEATLNLVQNMQFFIVHNNMDVGSVDILRRCSCACVERDRTNTQSVVSSCTGCV